jgi:hypothetical protein
MKTGRLIKFHRPQAEVHAYLYRDGESYRAAVYVMAAGRERAGEPSHTVTGATEADVENAVRAWVDQKYPRTT